MDSRQYAAPTGAYRMVAERPHKAGIESRRRDFGIIGRAQEAAAKAFVNALGIKPGERVLDVGCGTGNCSIAAARAGGDVTGVDPREPFLSRGRAWAKNENLLIRFKRSDRSRLPFSDGSFGWVISFTGVTFHPDPPGVLAQMRRVCRRDGRLAVAVWCAEGPLGDLLRTVHEYTGDDRFRNALEWGTAGGFEDFVGVPCRRGGTELRFPLHPRDVAQCFLDFYSPLTEAARVLDDAQREALFGELAELWQRVNVAEGAGTRVRVDYLWAARPSRPGAPGPRH